MSIGLIIVVLLASQVFFWAARAPMHRMLKKSARALGGAARIAARWCTLSADELRERNRDVLRSAALSDTRKKIEHELRALDSSLPKDLAAYRELQRELSDLVAAISEDYSEAGRAPSEAPGWSEAVEAAKQLPKMESKGAQRVLEELRRSAIDGEKRVLAEYRQATSQRHKLLSRLAPMMKKTSGLLQDVDSVMERVAESTSHLDEHVETYRQIKAEPVASERTLNRSAWHLFIISTIIMVVAIGGGLINFQLIALPMSELVPSTTRITGIPVSTIAALVIVMLELTAGVFLMEMLGVTRLFPSMQTLPRSRRRLILGIALGGLFVLSCVEASLAVLREQIVEAENALSMALAGSEAIESAQASNIPMIGQAVLGFILPWILALAAVPLELLVTSGTAVGVSALAMGLQASSGAIRVTGHCTRYGLHGARHLYDAYISVPLQIEKFVARRYGEEEEEEEGELVLERTGESEVLT